MKPHRQTIIALLLSLAAVFLTTVVSARVFENIPHLEDEIAYVWQARLIAQNHSLTLPSPPEPKSFLVPFVVDYHGQRFGKYPPGWPTLLAVGEFFGQRAWVNPLLAGLAAWLLYRLLSKILGQTGALVGQLLLLTSPFFWLNAGSLLSHLWGLVLTLIFVLGWLDTFVTESPTHGILPLLTAALALGTLALTRPFSAIGVALPFALHGLYLLVRGDRTTRRRLLTFGLLSGAVAGLYFVWQYALTGNFFTNPYTLWWSYDKVGFGPGHGVLKEGHNLQQAWINTRFSLLVGASDLFGWGKLSWIFVLPGIWALRREGRAWLIGGIAPTLVVLYLAYWVGSWLFGPRYYFEGLPGIILWSAAGIRATFGGGFQWKREPLEGRLAVLGNFRVPWGTVRATFVVGLVSLLVILNLRFYLPPRLAMMRDLYTINRARLAPFYAPKVQALRPAVVFVDSKHWMAYGALLELSRPDLTSPFIFAVDRGEKANQRVRAAFPERQALYYNPLEPYTFQLSPP